MQATFKLAMILANDPSVLQLGTGPLLHDICQGLSASAAATTPAELAAAPRLRLWSGHDTTVMPVMAALGLRLDRWPPYCSHVVRYRPNRTNLSQGTQNTPRKAARASR